MDKLKLKPCPFCGSAAVFRYNGENQYLVRCGNLFCKVYATTYVETTKAKAIAAWNLRKGEEDES